MKASWSFEICSLTVLTIAVGSACSGPAPDVPAASQPTPDKTPPSAAGATESERIQRFLDDRYLPSDVEHSFRTRFGQTIDCIDFYAQPGVKALTARGIEPVTTAPAPPANVMPGGSSGPSEIEFDGSLDENGDARACPDGTVAQIHLDATVMANAGRFDDFVSRMTHKPPPPGVSPSPLCAASPDYPNYAHVKAVYSGGIGAFTADASAFSINDPKVLTYTPMQDHSLSQTWTLSGTGLNGSTCSCSGADCVQSVEVGWDVDPVLNGDFGIAAGTAAVFIFSTNNGYAGGCYDGMSGSGCLPWVSLQGASLTPGTAVNLPSGQPGQQQHEVAFVVSSAAQGWFIYSVVDTGSWTAMGYYPAGNYYGTMQSEATRFQVGGEIYDGTDTWVTPMGTGETPAGGYGHAAYHRGFGVCTDSTCDSTFTLSGSTRPSDYAMATSPAAPPNNNSGNYFYFGSAAHVFWGQNYGFQWAPNGQDWANGSYKGECGLVGNNGQPIVGLSKYTSGSNQAHAVECWNQGHGTIANTGACYARNFGPGDNRGYTGDGDWDPGYNKGECAKGEYVLGVAQSQSGKIDSILCCPANLSGAACTPETFYSGNSTDYSAPDWDTGYYKGQCNSGGYVAGVSSVWSSSNGVPEAPHALLCCH